jgi:hypothetical protein
MNIGDKETFYPDYPGSGLNESGFCCGFLGNESSLTGDDDPALDDSNDNQDSTEYESEHTEVGGVAEENEPPTPGKCGFWDFRNKVKAKKEELKAQYGKGKLNILPCGPHPDRALDPKYNPSVRIPKVYWPGGGCGINPDLRPEYYPVPCVWDCSKAKNYNPDNNSGKPCCVTNHNKDRDKLAAFSVYNECKNKEGKCCMIQGNEEAYESANQRWNADMAVWHQCADQHPLWQPGWRKEWRRFKKDGGLNQLKDTCKAEMSGTPPPPPPPLDLTPVSATPNRVFIDTSGMTCKQIAARFHIIPGKKWGTAPENVRVDWTQRGCTITDKVADTTGLTGRTIAPDDTEKNKKMITIGIIAVVVIIAIALVVRAMKSKGKV